jgi:hypothetical protein
MRPLYLFKAISTLAVASHGAAGMSRQLFFTVAMLVEPNV